METMSLIRRNLLGTGKLAAEAAAAVVVLGLVATPGAGQGSPADATFIKAVQPFFAKNCYACHNSRLSSGGLNFETYKSTALFFQDRDEAEKILKRLQAGEMPPKALPRPNPEELRAVTNWIEADLDHQA